MWTVLSTPERRRKRQQKIADEQSVAYTPLEATRHSSLLFASSWQKYYSYKLLTNCGSSELNESFLNFSETV